MADGPWISDGERRHLFDTGRFWGDGPAKAIPVAGATGCGGCLFTVFVLSLIAFVVAGLLTGTFDGDDESLGFEGEQVLVGSLDCADGAVGLSLTMRQAQDQDDSTPGLDLDLDIRYHPDPLGTDADVDVGYVDRRIGSGRLDGATLSFEVADPGDQPFSATSGLGSISQVDGSFDYEGGVAAPACTDFAVRTQTG